MSMADYSYIRSLFELREGILYWKKKPSTRSHRVKIGEVAGNVTPLGYWETKVNGTRYYRSHFVLLLTHGEWPPAGCQIDHQDRNRANDHPANLRLCTNSQQKQ